MGRTQNCKERLLDAAESVVLESGAGHLSLDSVARKAGVSKGGLMYHFPTKEALLKAMIARMIALFYADREGKMCAIKEGPDKLLKAGVLATFDRKEKFDRMGLSILAAAAYDPELLEQFRQAHREHLKELLVMEIGFERAAIISLAADGLMMNELLGISPFSKAQRGMIKEELLTMVNEGVMV